MAHQYICTGISKTCLSALKGKTLILGRVLPRIHSPLAVPTAAEVSVRKPTPEDSCAIRVPVLEFNDFLKRYFKIDHDILAFNPEIECEEGDTVLLKRMEKAHKKDIEFQVQEVIHRHGDMQDPITNENVVGEHYREHLEQMAELYGRNPNQENPFDYKKAPKRGWQKGKRDFTDKVTYYRWHVMKNAKPDDYSLVS